jgi:hypothetical protein
VTTARILAIADIVDESIGPASIASIRPSLVVSCGDLPADYLEYVVTIANVPLLWVPGNHDPDHRGRPEATTPLVLPGQMQPVGWGFWEDASAGPPGCTAIDGEVVQEAGLLVGGLGGSIRYREGPNQYTQSEMRRRALRLELKTRLRHPRRRLDVLVTHSPPLGVGDADDPAHRGFASLHRLAKKLSPKVLLHGHVHPHAGAPPERLVGHTRVVNAAPRRVIEVEA